MSKKEQVDSKCEEIKQNLQSQAEQQLLQHQQLRQSAGGRPYTPRTPDPAIIAQILSKPVTRQVDGKEASTSRIQQDQPGINPLHRTTGYMDLLTKYHGTTGIEIEACVNIDGKPFKTGEIQGEWAGAKSTVAIDFKSVYQEAMYTWSDPIHVSYAWKKKENPKPTSIKLTRGYYKVRFNITASGNCDVRLYLSQTTQGGTTIYDNLYDAAPASDCQCKSRVTVSEAVGYIMCSVPVADKDRSGNIQMWISQRGAQIPTPEFKISHIDTIGKIALVDKVTTVTTLDHLTSKDLGSTTPLWTSTLPQRLTPPRGSKEEGWVRDLIAEGIESNPGPVFLIDTILSQAKHHKTLEACLALLSQLETSRPDNPFSCLAEMVIDDDQLETPHMTDELWNMVTATDGEQQQPQMSRHHSGIKERNSKSQSGSDIGLTPNEAARLRKQQSLKDKSQGLQSSDSSMQPTSKTQGSALSKLATGPSPVLMIAKRYLARLRKSCLTSHTMLEFAIDPTISRKVKQIVFNVIWRKGWSDSDLMTPLQYAAYCQVNVVSDQEKFDTVIDYVSGYCNTKVTNEHRAEAFMCLCSSPYVAGAAKIHNKEMHALNGNIYVRKFSEVDEQPGYWTVISAPNTPGPSNSLRICDFETFFTGYTQHEHVALGNIADQGEIRGEVVRRSGAIGGDRAIACPMSPLWPYKALFHASFDVEQEDRTIKTWKYVGETGYLSIGAPYLQSTDVEYRVNPLTPTDRAQKALAMVNETIATKFRQTDLDAMGFLSYDMFSMAGVMTPKGLSMEKCVLRLLMLHDITMLHKNPSVPRSIYQNIVGTMNPVNVADMEVKFRAGDRTITEVDKNPFDDPSQEETNVFPFVDTKGYLKFHMTLETVDHTNYDNILFAPPWIYDNFPTEREKALALYVLMFSEWPYGLYTVHGVVCGRQPKDLPPAKDLMNVNNRAGYLHLASLTRVPGLTRIDIILPRRAPVGRISTPVEAARCAYVRPQFGPNADAGFENAYMNICTPDNGKNKVEYTLWDYLRSWAKEWDPMFIHRFMVNVNANIGIGRHIDSMSDLLVALTYSYPRLISASTYTDDFSDTIGRCYLSDAGDDWLCAPEFFTCHTMWHGERPHTRKQLLPWPDDKIPAFFLMETSILGWNRVCLGLSSSEDVARSNTMVASDLLGHNKIIFWNLIKSLILTVPMGIYYSIQGMSSALWDKAIDYAENSSVRNIAMASFARQLAGSMFQPPLLYGVIMNIYSHVNTLPLGISYTMLNGVKVEFTVYARALRPLSFAKTIGQIHISPYDPNAIVPEPTRPPYCDTNNYYTPVLLVDAWNNTIMQKGIRFMSNMFAGCIDAGTYGYSKSTGCPIPQMSIVRDRSTNAIGPYVDNTAMSMSMGIPDNTRPRLSDEHLWNFRLFMTEGEMKIKTLMLKTISETYGDVNPWQRGTQENTSALNPIWSLDVPTNRADIIRCNTTCYAYMSISNDLVIPITNAAKDKSDLVSAMQHQTSRPREIWRFTRSILPTTDEYYTSSSDPWAELTDQYFAKAATITQSETLPESVVAQVETPAKQTPAPVQSTTTDQTGGAVIPNQIPPPGSGEASGQQ